MVSWVIQFRMQIVVPFLTQRHQKHLVDYGLECSATGFRTEYPLINIPLPIPFTDSRNSVDNKICCNHLY